MYGAAQNPVLDFVAIAAAIAAGFVFVNDTRSPVANASLYSRCAALLAVTFVTSSVLYQILMFFSPMFNGSSSGAAVLDFFGGLFLVAGLAGAFMVLRGDLKVNFERRAPTPVKPRPPVYSVGPSASTCAQCGGTLKPDALFCTDCGARTQALV